MDVDRQMLTLEMELATQRGKLSANAHDGEKIAVAQLKANLGMNAILSCSLALGRMIAARDGMELSDILKKLEGNISRDYLYSIAATQAEPAIRKLVTVGGLSDNEGSPIVGSTRVETQERMGDALST